MREHGEKNEAGTTRDKNTHEKCCGTMLPSLPRRPERELEEVVYDRAEGTSVPGECRQRLRQRLQGPAKLPPPAAESNAVHVTTSRGTRASGWLLRVVDLGRVRRAVSFCQSLQDAADTATFLRTFARIAVKHGESSGDRSESSACQWSGG